MIEFRCEGCGAAVKVSDELAGRSGRCTACGLPVAVPSPNVPSEPVGKQGRRTYLMIILAIGVLATIVAKVLDVANIPEVQVRGATLAVYVLACVTKVLPYSLILGVISILVGLVGRNVRKIAFPVFAWLFLLAGVFDVGGFVFAMHVNQKVTEIAPKLPMPSSGTENATAAKWLPDQFEASTHNTIGLSHYGKGEYAQAIEEFTRAIEFYPEFSVAYHNRALAHAERSEFDKTIADCSKAIAIRPSFAAPYLTRASAYYLRQSYDRVIADCTKAIELDPTSAEAYFTRGVAYSEKDLDQEAIADCTKAIELDPALGEAWACRAFMYYENGDYDRAWRDVKQCQKLGTKVDPRFLSLLERAFPSGSANEALSPEQKTR